MSGFVAIHRAAVEHPLFDKDPSRLGAWVWMVVRACWKPTKHNVRGATVTLERGQFCASRSQLAVAFKWSDSAVERFLTRLETEQMIERATGQGRTIITICNYDKYQDLSAQAGQATEQQTGHKSDSNRTAKEPSNHKTNKPNNIIPCPEGVSDEVWDDWLRLRNSKKAVVSERVLNSIRKEAQSVGWSLQDALAKMIERNWQGFEAGWVDAKGPKKTRVPI